MNKIIVALDGLRYSESAARYAREWSKEQKAFLTGVFLDDPTYTGFKIYETVLDSGISDEQLKVLKKKDTDARIEAADNFSEQCKSAGLQHRIHHDKKIAINDLIKETRFADLLVINRHETFSHHEQDFPSRFLKMLMNETECPLALVPASYKPVEKIILLYDGRFTSVFSMRQFAFLFSNYAHLPIELFCVRAMDEDLHLPDHWYLKEWMRRHFKQVNYHVVKGIPETEIIRFLKEQPDHSLLVMGARRRIVLSRWMRTGLLESILLEKDIPVFIAHS
jgi:hypothetical protein